MLDIGVSHEVVEELVLARNAVRAVGLFGACGPFAVGRRRDSSPVVAVVIWQFQASDEYIRFKMTTAAALAALITVLWTFTYSYLELIGFPKLSMMWVSNVGWLTFVVVMMRLMMSSREKPSH